MGHLLYDFVMLNVILTLRGRGLANDINFIQVDQPGIIPGLQQERKVSAAVVLLELYIWYLR